MLSKQTYLSDDAAKDMICDIGRRVYQKNFVAANDGNLSIKVGENEVWTTPTGVSKGFMTPDMLVKVDLTGKILEGTRKPSSELKMHLRVYRENAEVTAVVHAHPQAATAYAMAGVSLDRAYSPEGVILLGKVPVASYATPGTEEVPDSVAPFCNDYNAVLLANHGALTWGRDMIEAYYRMESLEHYSMTLLHTKKITNQLEELSAERLAELINIRERMGIKTGGHLIAREEAAEQRVNDGSSQFDRHFIESIVTEVTEEVLKRLKR
ncbi:class II aldolase/adducin family protein [Bacillaceae bacterium SIJ1]|uniref:class II aldolase/adducin family protein n=1 Tax=Litoribacterium kuwaitense TaxID=1398745 RepID=UPI0013ECABB0|nr:class II aldolase/adducin family protein [Litoribacterium kuwaitense]NGP45775.1 class II aldolase/adducin family protein [Litoribacterium kuwaitense]